jgi:predicted O-methyltransferase YrrM
VERDPEACAQAKRALQELDNRPRVRVYDETGELKYLSDEEKAELRRRAELTVELHCEG